MIFDFTFGRYTWYVSLFIQLLNHLITIVTKAQGKASLEAPPNSVHFSESHKLKIPTAAPPPVPTICAPPLPATTALDITPSYTNDLLRQLLQPQQQPQNLLLQLLLNQLPQTQLNITPQILPNFASSPASAPPTSPAPVKPLPRYVSLEEFCRRYEITSDTEEKLRKLEIIPGDVKGIESLERCDWATEGGFSKLGWDRFKDTHKRFMLDVHHGCFATAPPDLT